MDGVREELKDILISDDYTGITYSATIREYDFSIIGTQWIEWAMKELSAFDKRQLCKKGATEREIFTLRVLNVLLSFNREAAGMPVYYWDFLEVLHKTLVRFGVEGTIRDVCIPLCKSAIQSGYIFVDRDSDGMKLTYDGRRFLRKHLGTIAPPPFKDESEQHEKRDMQNEVKDVLHTSDATGKNENSLTEKRGNPFPGFANPSLPYSVRDAAEKIGMTGRESGRKLYRRIESANGELAVKTKPNGRKWYFNRDYGPEFKKLDAIYPEKK